MRAAIDRGLGPSNHSDFLATPLDPVFVMWTAADRSKVLWASLRHRYEPWFRLGCGRRADQCPCKNCGNSVASGLRQQCSCQAKWPQLQSLQGLVGDLFGKHQFRDRHHFCLLLLFSMVWVDIFIRYSIFCPLFLHC